MNSINFQRVNDHSFRFITPGDAFERQEIFLHVKQEMSPETYRMAKQISEYLLENKIYLTFKSVAYFQINSKVYTFQVKEIRRHERFARYLAKFFKFFRNPSKVEIDICEAQLPKKLYKNIIQLPGSDSSISVSPKEVIPTNNYLHSAFSDGYTKLASVAYQMYESDFDGHDTTLKQSDHSRYCIVQTGDQLELVAVRDYHSEENGQTLCNYRDYLIKEYGKEKVEYITHLYRIDLNAAAPLTPEIVYRMNIGVGNLEKQDLNQFVKKLDDVSNKLQISHSFEMDWLKEFTIHELRELFKQCKGKDVSAETLQEWFSSYRGLSKDKKMQIAATALSFSSEERAHQYTGREIVNGIKSSYTLADSKLFKPWIDEQELLHSFADLEKSYADPNKKNHWDNYYEILSHVICKRHLARQHPTEGYRVGAILPAPPNKNKEPQWYVVTSCISNGKGIHLYTLEPLVQQDSTLPVLKLFRSTARKNYAFDNWSTIKNDLNPINSPGYEGAFFMKKYHDDFFKQRTIPLWVGYNIQAARELDKVKDDDTRLKLSKDMYQAIVAFKKDREQSYRTKELQEIIQNHDADLLQLAVDVWRKSFFNLFKVWRLIKIIQRYKNNNATSYQTQKDDLHFLSTMLEKEHVKYQGLKENLNQQLQNEAHLDQRIAADREAQLQLLTWFVQGDYPKIISTLNDIAKKEGELPEQKLKQSVMFVGHSLGGACAQKFFVDYTAKMGRIPLEGTEMGIRTFDSPAINHDDNQAYKHYGFHKSLFHDLNVKFSIIHRFEAGDFVSQAGGEHLGASSNAKEQEDLQDWTQFEASVSEALTSSDIRQIRDSTTAHATQFEKGKRNPSMIVNKANEMLKIGGLDKETELRIANIVKDRMGDYERTWVDPQILWKFNHGDKKTWTNIQSVWQEFGFFSPTVERLRSFFGLILRVFFVGITINVPVEKQPDVGHGDWWKYRDANGVFAVDLNHGITSKGSVERGLDCDL